jgi:hypothetical protein
MKQWRKSVDRAAGRLYSRLMALATGAISAVMLIAALVSWWRTGPVGGGVWLLGAVVFGAIALASWRGRAGLSDGDFSA